MRKGQKHQPKYLRISASIYGSNSHSSASDAKYRNSGGRSSLTLSRRLLLCLLRLGRLLWEELLLPKR